MSYSKCPKCKCMVTKVKWGSIGKVSILVTMCTIHSFLQAEVNGKIIFYGFSGV